MTNATDARGVTWAELHEPSTSGARLAQIAQAHPDFAEAIGRHPQAYPALVEWSQRVRGAGAGGSAASTETSSPASSIVLIRRIAWIAVLLLFLAGQLLYTPFGVVSDWTIWINADFGVGGFNLIVSILMALGALIGAAMAPTIARRIAALLLVGLAAIVLFTWAFPFLNGLLGLWRALDVWDWPPLLLFLAWALSWPLRRSAFAAVAVFAVSLGLTIVVINANLDFGVLTWAVGFAAPFVAVMVAALVSRATGRSAADETAISRSTAARIGSPMSTSQASSMVSYGPTMGTNIMAILSLVFAFVFSLLGVIFGHVALSQIRRTGEQGRGLAIAGLVIGYLSLVTATVVVILWIVMFAQLVQHGTGVYDG